MKVFKYIVCVALLVGFLGVGWNAMTMPLEEPLKPKEEAGWYYYDIAYEHNFGLIEPFLAEVIEKKVEVMIRMKHRPETEKDLKVLVKGKDRFFIRVRVVGDKEDRVISLDSIQQVMLIPGR